MSAQRSSRRELATADSADPLGVMLIAAIMIMALMVITVIMISNHRCVVLVGGFAMIA